MIHAAACVWFEQTWKLKRAVASLGTSQCLEEVFCIAVHGQVVSYQEVTYVVGGVAFYCIGRKLLRGKTYFFEVGLFCGSGCEKEIIFPCGALVGAYIPLQVTHQKDDIFS